MLRVTPCMHCMHALHMYCMHAPGSQALHVLSPTNFIQQQFRKKKTNLMKRNYEFFLYYQQFFVKIICGLTIKNTCK